MGFFVGILEMFGEISKIISFSFRLFGNVFAGEVLLVIILGLVAYIASYAIFRTRAFCWIYTGTCILNVNPYIHTGRND